MAWNFHDLFDGCPDDYNGDPKAKNRAEQILTAFLAFHQANPGVWNLFCRFTFDVINRGHSHYSSDAICHRIRWHTQIETQGELCKINDHYTAYYARMFAIKFPEHADFFENRKRPSLQTPARKDYQPVMLGVKAGREDQQLMEKLTALVKAA